MNFTLPGAIKQIHFYQLRNKINPFYRDLSPWRLQFLDAPTTTFDRLEQEEMDRELGETPWNGFQEQIQLTKTGKLWRFPVDNEYGTNLTEQDYRVLS